MDRLEKLKLNSIENPGKPKRGCKTCKKPKEVVVEKLPLPFELEPEIYIPTIEDIKNAYIMLGSPKEEEKPFIKKVYESLFDDEFDFTCNSCVHTQTRILKNYITGTLKLKL